MKQTRISRIFLMFIFLLFVACKKDQPLKPLPVADFFYVIPQAGKLPTEVKFSSVSTNADTYNWDFGNGMSSALEKPTIVYSESGVYSVKLVVSNAFGADSIIRNLRIDNTRRPRKTVSFPNLETLFVR